MKRGFTLIELMVTIVIIGALVTAGLGAFSTSQVKSRDARRKGDLRQVAVALETYYNDKGSYPLDDGLGNPMGCGAGAIGVCNWGGEFSNTTPAVPTVYMVQLSKDPTPTQHYYYISVNGGKSYRLYGRLENSKDRDVMILSQSVNCGGNVSYECNYGIASSNTTP